MTMRKSVRSMLRAGIFTGAVGLLPAVALAGGEAEPSRATPAAGTDHATVEAEGAGAVTGSGRGDQPGGVPDHAAAQARGADDPAGPRGADLSVGVPDHQAAEEPRPIEAAR
jgi:hypothetical protein